MECALCVKDKIKNETLEETPNFVLVSALGSFIPFYLLIISKTHVTSLSSIINSSSLEKEFEKLKRKAEKFVETKTGNGCIAFEHAADQIGRAGCCVDHMHLHLLPCKNGEKIVKQITNSLGLPMTIKTYSDLTSLFYQNMPYLLVETNKIYIWKDPLILSQFMRRVLAEEYNTSEKYDWRKYPFHENMIKTMREWKKWKK